MVRINTRLALRELESMSPFGGDRMRFPSELPGESVYVERDGSMWLVQLGRREEDATVARSPRMALKEIRRRLRIAEAEARGLSAS